MAKSNHELSVDHIARLFVVPPWLIDPSRAMPGRFSFERLRWRYLAWRYERSRRG